MKKVLPRRAGWMSVIMGGQAPVPATFRRARGVRVVMVWGAFYAHRLPELVFVKGWMNAVRYVEQLNDVMGLFQLV